MRGKDPTINDSYGNTYRCTACDSIVPKEGHVCESEAAAIWIYEEYDELYEVLRDSDAAIHDPKLIKMIQRVDERRAFLENEETKMLDNWKSRVHPLLK